MRQEPPLEDGMLQDPAARYGRFLNPHAVDLRSQRDIRCLVLLGDPGSGKSDELLADADRFRTIGSAVRLTDLGTFSDWQSVRNEVFRHPDVMLWESTASDELVLLLDGFDEAFTTVAKLANGLSRELGRLPLGRLRLRITARPSVWPASLSAELEGLWPGSIATLVLAPLTPSDIVGAANVIVDGEAFLEQVRIRDLGPLAARPITLRLLLSVVEATGGFPDGRVELYASGVAELVAEHHDRRVEERADGPTRQRRLRAGEDTATISLLSGRPTLVRRHPFGGSGSGVLALEDVETSEITTGDLDAIWDSGLLTPIGATMAWSHRTLAEFLCARRLTRLPNKTIVHLLAHPQEPDHVVPQLAGVAVWLACMREESYEWLAAHEPDLLLTPDLVQQTAAARRMLGRALLARLQNGHAPSGRRHYGGLSYPELASDLAPLLATHQPSWVQREAIKIAADNGIRDHDSSLVTIIETSAAKWGSGDYNDEIALAGWAVFGLQGVQDHDLVQRLTAVAAAADTPDSLRADLVTALWPHLDVPGFLAMLRPDILGDGRRRLARSVADGIGNAIGSGSLEAVVVIDWLITAPPSARDDDAFAEVAGVAVLQAAASLPDDSPAWARIGHLIASQMLSSASAFRWTPDRTTGLAPNARRRLAFEALTANEEPHPADVATLREAGLIQSDDFEWWIDRYRTELGRGTRNERAALLVTTAVGVPAEPTLTVARSMSDRYPQLRPWFDEWFGPIRVQRWAESEDATRRRAEEDERRRIQRTFSNDAVGRAIATDDWPAACREFQKPTVEDEAARRAGGHADDPMSARSSWQSLDGQLQQALIAAAVTFLTSRGERASREFAEAAADAYALIADGEPGRLEGVSPASVLGWLPQILDLAGHHDTARGMIAFAAPHYPSEVERLIVDRLEAQAKGEWVPILDRLGTYTTPGIEKVLVTLLRMRTLHPYALSTILGAALARVPDDASQVALDLIKNRPRTVPARLPGEAADLNEPRLRAWYGAVHAAATLACSEAIGKSFDELLGIFEADPAFAIEVIRTTVGRPGFSLPFGALAANQLADLFLWARANLPSPQPLAPGVGGSVNWVEEFPGDLHRRLLTEPDAVALLALDRIADSTGDVWLRSAAETARETVRAASWSPMQPEDVREVLRHAERRVITGEAQLGTVLLEALDTLGDEVRHDAGLRQLFWQRQAGKPTHYIPCTENEFSDRVARLLSERLRHTVIRREVQLQPRLGAQPGEFPDIEVTVKLDDGQEIACPIEVKGNWHAHVEEAIETQLARRYLLGPRGKTGIYLVAWYGGSAWAPEDSRRNAASRQTLVGLHATLAEKARQLAAEDLTTHVRVMDVTLEQADIPVVDGDEAGSR